MSTPTNLLIPALIFVAVGFLAGILIMSLVSDRRRRRDDSDQGSKAMEELIIPEMPVLPETRFESIAALYRETRSGKLITDIKGKVYLNHNSIPEEQLRSLQEAAQSWQTWLGMPVPLAPAIEPLPTPPAPVVETAPTKTVGAPEPLPAQLDNSAEQLPDTTAPEFVSAAIEPVGELESSFTNPSAADEPTPMVPEVELSANQPENEAELPKVEPIPVMPVSIPVEKPRARTMVGQIDEVLQEILPDTIYAGQNIHLSEEFTNGVVVWVGAQKYIGIESVPDPEIKALIQSAVRKWEATAGHI
jgi:hypothetical protein